VHHLRKRHLIEMANEIEENIRYKDKIEPLKFSLNKKGNFSISFSLMQYTKLKNGTIWLTLIGLRNFEDENPIGLKIELKEMSVFHENDKVEKFIPTRFGLRKLNPDDIKYGKRLINFLNENRVICPYDDLKDFSGFELETNDKFFIDSLMSSKVKGIASNILNKKNKNYFDFTIDFDFRNNKVTIIENELEYREKIF
jgi:hypothetical protein